MLISAFGVVAAPQSRAIWERSGKDRIGVEVKVEAAEGAHLGKIGYQSR